MYHDLRSALRTLGRAPGFVVLVVATLGLGIGGASAIFSLVNTLLLRPLPFEEESRLVRMRDAVSRPGEGVWRYNSSPRSYVAMRKWGGVFEGVVAQRYRPMILSSPGDPARVVAIGVSAGWTEVLGVGPVVGRPFSGAEASLGAESRAVLLGHGLWLSRFGGRPDVVGEAVRLDDRLYTVVGVMPASYNYPYGAELWVPDTFDIDDVAAGPNVVGRLSAGLSLEAAQSGLDELSGALAEAYPESHASIRLLAVPIRDDLVSNHPRLGLALLLGAGVLLALACFNIANLLLVRGAGRRTELAIRAAMGAAAPRQARQLFFESLALGVLGGGVGLALAAGLHRLMAGLSVEADSSLGAFFTDLSLDWRVAGFALLLGGGTAMVFGVLPALGAARVEPRRVLIGGRGGGRPRERWLNPLIAAELAVAFVLLAGAGLMVQNLVALQRGDRGYATADRITFQVGMAGAGFAADSARVRFMGRVLDRLASEPAVRTVGAVQHLPFDDGSSSTSYSIEGGPSTEGERRLLANARIVAGAYFQAMGMPILQGRTFSEAELREPRDVVVVNRAFADRYWPDGPLGRRLKLGALADEGPWLTVVGVVATAEENFELEGTMYVPYVQSPAGEMNVVAMVPGTGDHARALREAVWAVDPGQPLSGLGAVEGRLRESLASQFAATRLMVGFAGFGLLLAGLGIYGVMAYSVRRRRHELAIRRALGLTRQGAIAAVLRKAMVLAVAGLAVGVPGAVAFTRLLTGVLSGSTTNVAIDIRLVADHASLGPWGYAALATGLALAALAAAAVPAVRAATTDPARALRDS